MAIQTVEERRVSPARVNVELIETKEEYMRGRAISLLIWAGAALAAFAVLIGMILFPG